MGMPSKKYIQVFNERFEEVTAMSIAGALDDLMHIGRFKNLEQYAAILRPLMRVLHAARSIPDQRRALRSLRNAVRDLHPLVVEDIFLPAL